MTALLLLQLKCNGLIQSVYVLPAQLLGKQEQNSMALDGQEVKTLLFVQFLF